MDVNKKMRKSALELVPVRSKTVDKPWEGFFRVSQQVLPQEQDSTTENLFMGQNAKEITVEDIVHQCLTKAGKKNRSLFYNQEIGEIINLKRLTELLNETYGLEVARKEYRSEMSKSSSAWNQDFGLKWFVAKRQLFAILESCLKATTFQEGGKEVDFDRLIRKLKTFYDVNLAKWQLSVKGDNAPFRVLQRLGSDYEPLLKEKFQRALK